MGWSLIAFLWVVAAYLAIHYAALLLLGPERLVTLLGGRLYNLLVPAGGFTFLILLALAAAVWLVPFGMALFSTSWALRLVPRLTRPRRLWLSAVAACGVTLSLPFVMLDGWPWALMPLAWEDDTEFAQGYSALGFWLVTVGMSPDEVLDRLGPPLERYPISESRDEGWRWSRSPHDGSYRVRVVIFREGRVAAKHSEFYVD